MRYSLRTLLLAVTLVAVSLAGVAWWREHRRSCLAWAEYHESKIIRLGGYSIPGPNAEEIIRRAEAERALNNAHHEHMKQQYLQAVWRPWLLLLLEDPPEPVSEP